MTPKEITDKIEETLFELYDLIKHQNSIDYLSFRQHTRIKEKCRQIYDFFE